jgi:glycine/D-amino acid oxidase-like deaminating enzyme/nitrite reductase/ring-hydroxylating ferredoxin subunit
LNFIEKIIQEEKIECDFERVDGYLFNPPGTSQKKLEKEYQAIKKIGMKVEKVEKAPFNPSFETGLALKFDNQAQFHPLKYLKGLIEGILKHGGQIFNNSFINSIEDGSPCLLKTTSGVDIKAGHVIVATCTPINDRFYIHTKQAAYRTYVIGSVIAAGSVPKGLYWDTEDPYHYVRTHKHLKDPKLEWLLVGGEDHKTGQCEEIENKYNNLIKWARKRFPMIEKAEYKWSGQVFEPVDSLAFIGKNPRGKNVYIVTGDSGNGLTHGTIAGFLIPDLIEGKKTPLEKVYNPARKTFRAIPKFLKENLNVFVQYLDWLTPGMIQNISQLKKEEGKILRKGALKLAVYKDKNGQIFINSALCPHLGGCVRWNKGEKSWDCPCHGARYNGEGRVINGPSMQNMNPH